MAYEKNMTEGNELSHIIGFTLPLLMGNIFQQLYNIVDSVIVGRYLGYDALASVGATGSVTFLFYTLCIGLSVGSGILISQSFGANREDDVKKFIVNSAYAALIFGLAVSVIAFSLSGSLLRLMKTPEDIFSAAHGYMQIACLGTVAVSLYNWINAVMRSLGDSRTPLIFLIIASIINVLLDLLFVIVFKMGVNGAALATVIAQAASAAGCIVYAFVKVRFFRFSEGELDLRKYYFSKCIKTGVPIALQNSMISVSMIFLQSVANTFGSVVMAAYTATMRVEQLIQQPFSSLNAALSTFAGQNMGAGLVDRTVRGYRKAVMLMSFFALFMLALFLIASRYVIGIFVTEEAVIEIGANALKLSAFFYIPLGLIHTTRGLLNGAGDVTYAMINGFVEVIGRIGFALILLRIPSIGYWAVWGTTCLTWLLTAVMSVLRYRFGKWKNKVRI